MKPEFFIVGSPKCGTTSLAAWLGAHPDIFMCPIKEPNYYCLDAPRLRAVTTIDSYRWLFRKSAALQLWAEASTAYLFSDCAIPAIMTDLPDAKIIMMIRNPIDMIQALHAQKLLNLKEDVTDFEVAWRLSPQRAKGQQVPRNCPAVRWLDYQSQGRLGSLLLRLKIWVPAAQLHVIVFDDLIAAPAMVYRKACNFLGLNADETISFDALNKRRELRSAKIGRFIRNPPWPGKLIKRAALHLSPLQAKALSKRIWSWNAKPAVRRPLSAPFRRELREYYRADVALLGQLIKRDLSHWLQ